jgi:hypothetical protein
MGLRKASCPIVHRKANKDVSLLEKELEEQCKVVRKLKRLSKIQGGRHFLKQGNTTPEKTVVYQIQRID